MKPLLKTYSGINALLQMQLEKHLLNKEGLPPIFEEISGSYDQFEADARGVKLSMESNSKELLNMDAMLKAKREKLLLSEARLKEAQAIAHIGSWDRDLSTGVFEWSDEACRIYGIDPRDNQQTCNSWIPYIHPEDLDRCLVIVKNSYSTETGSSFHHRIVRNDGSVRHLLTTYEFVYNKEGKAVRLYGIVHDVTRQKLIEQEKEFERNNLFSLINNTKDLMWSIDNELKLITSNSAFDQAVRSISGHSPKRGEELVLTNLDAITLERWKNYYARAFSGEVFTVLEHTTDPIENWSEISFYPIRKKELIVGTACYSRNITEIKKAELEIIKLNAGLEVRVKQRIAELESTNRLLEMETERLVNASRIIEQKNKDITDSLNYAKLIQNALVDKKDSLKQHFADSFALSMPLDIVSGDFIKGADKKGLKLLALADCTGHGVPGALMSMVGSTLINDAMNGKLKKPSLILRSIDAAFKAMNNESSTINDGMDVGFCTVDLKTLEFNFAGAHRPVYIVRKNELIEIRGDYFSIGGAEYLNKKYTNHNLKLQKEDAVYLFSDGFTDQFGGKDGKKFSTKRFKQLLLSIQKLSMKEQGEYLRITIEGWKKGLAQLDDICVLGIRI